MHPKWEALRAMNNIAKSSFNVVTDAMHSRIQREFDNSNLSLQEFDDLQTKWFPVCKSMEEFIDAVDKMIYSNTESTNDSQTTDQEAEPTESRSPLRNGMRLSN